MIKKILSAIMAIGTLFTVQTASAQSNTDGTGSGSNNSQGVQNQNQNQNQRGNMNQNRGRSTIGNITINGTIETIGADNSTLTIRLNGQNRIITVTTTTNSIFMEANNVRMNFSDLRVGDRVIIRGTITRRNTMNGRVTTIRAITIRELLPRQ
jgi:hypothetical protein